MSFRLSMVLFICRTTTYIHMPSTFFFFSDQTIKSQHIATVRRLANPPHLIMRIMDCVLVLFRKKLDTVVYDPERNCAKPSWGESLKVSVLQCVQIVFSKPLK